MDDAGGLSACECLLRPLDSHDDFHDQVAFNRGEDKVRDETPRILNKFEWIAVRPDELRLRQRNQGCVK